MADGARAGEAVLNMLREMPVCVACWRQRYPQAELPLKAVGGTWRCVVCQERANEVIFRGMRVAWP